MDSAKKELDEAQYEPGRAVADIDTGEEPMSPAEVAEEDGDLLGDLDDERDARARSVGGLSDATVHAGEHGALLLLAATEAHDGGLGLF